MAEEKAEAMPEVSSGSAPSSGGKPILFIALALFNMLVVAGVGFMIYAGKQKEAKEPGVEDVVRGELETQAQEQSSPQFIGQLIPLETFLVNLAGSRGQKLVKINMELEVNNVDVQQEIDKLKPKIRDIIIIIVSGKSYQQLSTSDGKDNLRKEIRDQVNLFLTKGKINSVFFTEFLYN